MTLQLVDIGVNLSDKAFDKDRDEVISRAVEHGVTTMILTGTSLAESQEVLDLARNYPGLCFSTAGIHPHGAKGANAHTFRELKALFSEPEVVAVGETGLDFNRDFSPRPVQEKVFEQQLELAIECGLPLFCHEREASERFADIIKNYRDQVSKLVVHCFTADKKALYRYLDLDCHIGMTGWICDERRGTHLHPLVKDIPVNRLMVETDSPWLLPRSLTKKPKSRRNEPAFLSEVVQMIATHTGLSPEQIARQTRETSLAFFNLTAHHHGLQGQDEQ
ncbi:TatD family hydrolase [Endozoicomonas sp. SCSIO W0465]|uniref:TatD family hydrolase n=1 Tax=Endozoicomonas sp. SCSIO W0465 TaxID=2918516 RepID=UPI002075AF37|nr:TatD family hydrolase [Endozoicomonas sp. SCSIO W0465]USE39468.1 TatD family hydrolase [Endozoicomonas sp. SCSIO W0465]